MNSTPNSELYRFITSGFIDYSQADKQYISGQLTNYSGRVCYVVYAGVVCSPHGEGTTLKTNFSDSIVSREKLSNL